jgi:hypothetical protein
MWLTEADSHRSADEGGPHRIVDGGAAVMMESMGS